MVEVFPESIEAVNVEKETALHIAVKNSQFEAINFLVKRVREMKMDEMFNMKDETQQLNSSPSNMEKAPRGSFFSSSSSSYFSLFFFSYARRCLQLQVDDNVEVMRNRIPSLYCCIYFDLTAAVQLLVSMRDYASNGRLLQTQKRQRFSE